MQVLVDAVAHMMGGNNQDLAKRIAGTDMGIGGREEHEERVEGGREEGSPTEICPWIDHSNHLYIGASNLQHTELVQIFSTFHDILVLQ